MEWLALAVWIIVALIGLALGPGALMGAPGLGLVALTSVAGLALCIVFLVDGGARLPAWVAFGLSIVGLLGLAAGTAKLTSGEHSVSLGGQDAEEVEASLAGFELPLLITAAALTLCMALDVATVA